MKNVNNITDKEILEFAYRKKDFLDSPVRRQQIAQYVIGNSQQIADGMQIPEEEAYQMYLNHVKKRYSEAIKKREEELKKSFESLVFTESEITPQLMDTLAKHGIRTINTVPDDEYEEYMFKEYLKSLRNQT